MKHKAVTMVALLAAAMAGAAQADDGRWKLVKPGVVADTFAGVQWTQRDNLGNVNWHDAKAHCASLALDGGGWQLPTMNEISQLHSGARGNKVPCANWQCSAPKPFYLTGPWFWSSEQGDSSSEAVYFSLYDGTRHSGHVSHSGSVGRALCVRRRS